MDANHHFESFDELQDQVTRSGLVGSWMGNIEGSGDWSFRMDSERQNPILYYSTLTKAMKFADDCPFDVQKKVELSAVKKPSSPSGSSTNNKEPSLRVNDADDISPSQNSSLFAPWGSFGLFGIGRDVPDLIIEKLYLGSHNTAQNLDALKSRNITHILTVATGLSQDYPEQFKYMRVNAWDFPGQDLLRHFDECFDFIDEARQSNDGGGVLVHCAAGISRSATVTIGYVMRELQLNANEAREYVVKRHWCCPNEGFSQQLDRWEDILRGRREQNENSSKSNGTSSVTLKHETRLSNGDFDDS